MLSGRANARPEILRAYVNYERDLAIDKCRVACLLRLGTVRIELQGLRERAAGGLRQAQRLLTEAELKPGHKQRRVEVHCGFRVF